VVEHARPVAQARVTVKKSPNYLDFCCEMVQTNVRSDTEIFESMQDEFSSGLLVTVEVMRSLRGERMARLQVWERYREEWKT
jgi:hypothetical protein